MTNTASLATGSLRPPAWATEFGEDRFGIYAALDAFDVEFLLRWLPPGSFQMGSDPGEKYRGGREEPRHWVTLTRGFWLGETQVTQTQWKAVMGSNPSEFKHDASANRWPVEKVSWEDCLAFVTKLNEQTPGLGAGLPTEAQWEYACRAGTETRFNGGADEDESMLKLGWCWENSKMEGARQTREAAGKKPNQRGIFDMHGNVWEWSRDGLREYGEDSVIDPVGPTGPGARRAVRGGSWYGNARFCRSAIRFELAPDARSDYRGFRLAAGLELKEKEAEPSGERMKGAERP